MKKAKESRPMEVGCLVETTDKVFTMPSYEEEDEGLHHILEKGTIGIIINRPSSERPRQFLINFVGGQTYWMFHNEIQPYMGEKNV
jgi:hypothetical protein